MSNKRRSGYHNAYRAQYLCSPAWHARRDRWFASEHRRSRPLVCHGCALPATREQVELHHLSYLGVIRRDGGWHAAERHEDLIPLHPYCHDLLHRLIDRDAVLSRGRDRHVASLMALARLRKKLLKLREPS
jgi:5-methylcytosine-specific restriction protein A